MYFEVVTHLTQHEGIRYHARIKAANHEILFVTQAYRDQRSAEAACQAVKIGASVAPIRYVTER